MPLVVGDCVQLYGNAEVVGYKLDTHTSLIHVHTSSSTYVTLSVSTLLFGIKRQYEYAHPHLEEKKTKKGLLYHMKIGKKYYKVITNLKYKKTGKATLINVKTGETKPHWFHNLKKLRTDSQPGFSLRGYVPPPEKFRGYITDIFVKEERSRDGHFSRCTSINDRLLKQIRKSKRKILKAYVVVQTKYWTYTVTPNLLEKI